MRVSRPYSAAVILLTVLAIAFGVFGTIAPPLAEEGAPIQPQQGLPSEAVGHFANPPTYDSGWVDITAKTGQYVTLKHNLNTTNVVIDIAGKQSLNPECGGQAWSQTYGGTAMDSAFSVVQTSDGGYAIAGNTESYGSGGFDFWLVKTDSSGTMQWSQTYGGSGDDRAYSLVQTVDGGYGLAGWTTSYGAGSWDFWLVKTYDEGSMEWSQTYGGAGDDRAFSMIQASDGGYALAGYTNSSGAGNDDFWLVKTDLTGTMLWNKTYGETSGDVAHSLIQTGDGGYALAGYTGGGINVDFWLVKTDLTGTMQWNKTYGDEGLPVLPQDAFSLVETGDGGYALAGTMGTPPPNILLVKTGSTGTLLWSQTYGGAGTDYARSLVQTDDGGYALAGTNFANTGDFWLIKTDPEGSLEWSQTYGGASGEGAESLVQTSDGGYALAGRTSSFGAGGVDFWLVKVSPDMSLEHQRNLGIETGLARTGLTNATIILYRGSTDLYWNYVRVRIWLIEEPSWVYGDINMDGVVDNKDLYIIGRNYGQTFSLLSLTGIIAVASMHTIKTRKQQKPHNKKPTPTEPLEALWQAFEKKKDKK